jgi:integrase
MWTKADLEKLFKTPIWAGCKSEGRRSTPGSLVIRDEKFWLPLIAVFSGARQEEICQLHVEDIRQEEGVWLFDINPRPPRKLKNRSAVRLVPIHDELIRIGFLGYVDEQRKAGNARVFPNLNPGGADDRLGHGFTKWFTRYRRDVGLYEAGKDFHSFRHSATTFLHQGRVSDSIVDRLTGHTTPGETARYTKSTDIAQLKAAIETIDVGVVFSSLYRD